MDYVREYFDAWFEESRHDDFTNAPDCTCRLPGCRTCTAWLNIRSEWFESYCSNEACRAWHNHARRMSFLARFWPEIRWTEYEEEFGGLPQELTDNVNRLAYWR